MSLVDVIPIAMCVLVSQVSIFWDPPFEFNVAAGRWILSPRESFSACVSYDPMCMNALSIVLADGKSSADIGSPLT